jgi:hypothetical protein
MRRFQPLTRGLAVLALAGLAAGPASTALASAHHPGRTAPAARTAAAVTAPWQVRHLAHEGLNLRGADQAISVARRQDFALVPTGSTGQPYRLERFAVTGGHLLRGPKFAVSQIQLADGFAWVYGAVFLGPHSNFVKLLLSQVNEQTLAVVRSWALVPLRRAAGLETVALTPGPGHSVWVGYQRTLHKVDTATGLTTRRLKVPAGFSIGSLATDPAVRHLYVGTTPAESGGAVFEYLAGSGRQLAPARGRLLRDSVGGVELTAVPGGAFGTFRTGMLGEVVKLTQRGLRNHPLHNRIFGFSMFATTVYGGGALFLANDDGGTGCISIGGAVRHTTTISALKNSGELLTTDRRAHLVYGLGPHGLLAITPPAGCWG